MNKYELIKTVGFTLEQIQAGELETKIEKLKNQSQDDQKRREQLGSFIEKAEEFIRHFKNFVFIKEPERNKEKNEKLFKKSEQKKKIQKENGKNNKLNNIILSDIHIKYQWLHKHTKNDFFSWSGRKKGKNKYFIREVPFLKEVLQTCIAEWKNISKNLKDDLEASPEKLERRSQTALLIDQFSRKQILSLIRDFVYYSNPKEAEQKKNELKVSLKEVEASLIELQRIYLPFQSAGLVLAKASFNFYTVNKTPRNYDKEIKEIEEEMNSPCPSGNGYIQLQFHKWIQKWMTDNQDEETEKFFKAQRLNEESDLKKPDLKASFGLIKIYKAKAKKLFEEDVSRGLSYQEIKKRHPLFDSKETEYKKFKNKTRKIEQINIQIEKIKNISSLKEKIKCLKSERERLKKEKGKFFQFQAKPYINVCKNYERVAKKFGQLNAQIRGIQKEKIESQLLNHWAVILEKQGEHELLLIHRNNMQKAKDIIKNGKKETDGVEKLHWFSSLTLRALNKLCFGTLESKDTEFLKGVKQELVEYGDIKGLYSFKNESTKEIDGKRLVEFYQKVLKSQYTKNVLEMEYFGNLQNVLNTNFQSLNAFQSALEKACYKKIYVIDGGIKSKLLGIGKSCLFKINSYDLSLKDKDIKTRHHTRLWNEFWSGKNEEAYYPFRLNPEISVFWREKQDYRFKDGKYNSVIRNRFLKPQWNLRATLTLNATQERVDLSFKKPENIKEEIIKFNKKFYEYTKDRQIFYYGLDRGSKELATLCVAKENSEHNKNLIPSPIEIYSLKEKYYNDKRTTGHKAGKNPSYFINEAGLFEKRTTPTLDLTTAKLIDGKIVENGDIFTYLKFKELSAKRILFKYKSEMVDQEIHSKNNKSEFYIKTINRGRQKDKTVYYFRKEFKEVLTTEDIQKELKNYLNKLHDNQVESCRLTEKKINHLRNAVASNISGILAFLHKKNPGLIIFEKNQKGRDKEENIAGQLEWALYRKFQTEGLVPPCLKEVDLLLKNTKKSVKNIGEHNQGTLENKNIQIENFGLIHFIDPDDTSQICPRCNKKSNRTNYKNRKKEGWFKCEKCDFNTKTPIRELSFLDSPDKVAAYNICKKGKKHFRS